MKNSIDIFTHHYFPFHLIVLGIAFLLIALLVSLMYPLLAIVLLILGILCTTTHYRVMIDTSQKHYKEYLWILGFKKGEVFAYQNIEYLYVKQSASNFEYGFVSRVSGSKTLYSGYLQLADDEALFLGENGKKKKLMKKISKLSDGLHTEIKDYT